MSGSKRNLEDVEDQVEFVRAEISSFTSVLRMVEKHRAKTIYDVGAEGEGMKCEIQEGAGKHRKAKWPATRKEHIRNSKRTNMEDPS